MAAQRKGNAKNVQKYLIEIKFKPRLTQTHARTLARAPREMKNLNLRKKCPLI